MEQASPARLYATLTGAALVLFGILGFFYSASFGSPGEVDEALGVFAVNGWANVFHIVLGALGLLLAGFASRSYALGTGALLIAVGVWGFLLGSGGEILGFLPVDTGDNLLHLALGGLGLLAAVGTPRPAARKAEPDSSAGPLPQS
jgi:uncharacterized protein DUF4383